MGSNTLAIAKREFRGYFNSPVAYVVICGVLLLVGFLFFFFRPFFVVGKASCRELFTFIGMTFLFFAPAVTMRLLAEERKTGTLEILITMPVRDAEVILGKFLAAVGLLCVMLLLTLPFPITIAQLGDLDMGPVLGGYAGLLLEGSAFLALGMLASSLTEHQIVAFFLALLMGLVFFMLDWALPYLPGGMTSVVEYLSFGYHFEGITRGVIDSRDVVYFLSVIAVALALSFRQLESRKWK
ncbi:MAG: ABC transporter permease subunit [Deltaproteobacteria bacterium]|nr:ABC transporter permease subunit [Deltaproteobacteria bacterium]